MLCLGDAADGVLLLIAPRHAMTETENRSTKTRSALAKSPPHCHPDPHTRLPERCLMQ